MSRLKRAIAIAALALGTVAVAAPALAVPEVNHKGFNFVVGTFGNDVLVGTRHNDFMLGLAGNDRIFGLRGNDVLRGGRGNDRLFAGSLGHGNDRDLVRGGPGFDICRGDAGDVFVACEVVITG
jgi:hypothetical protein